MVEAFERFLQTPHLQKHGRARGDRIDQIGPQRQALIKASQRFLAHAQLQ
jgi:hypothetical protein